MRSSDLVLTDALGRSCPDIDHIGVKRDDKYVLIFYHIWHHAFTEASCRFDPKGPRNVTQILTENNDALTNSSVWGGQDCYHYWGEPLWGYYDIRYDEYVIRKHAQMLSDAGVDAIVIDYTNYMASDKTNCAYTKEDLTKLLDTFKKIRSEGSNTPDVVLMTTWDYTIACKAMRFFYEDYYLSGEYDDLWFRWQGKPLALAWDETMDGDLKEYFTFRRPYPFGTPTDTANSWPWLSAYPQQPAFTETDACEMVSVGVAGTDPYKIADEDRLGGGMSGMDTGRNFIASGRSSTSYRKILTTDPLSDKYGTEYGYAFQENFNRAIELDPSIIFVTGWNEWIAARFTDPPAWANIHKVPEIGVFFDQFCCEFSRDIEVTRDSKISDNYYNQLVMNIRRFKGSTPAVHGAQKKTIKINGDFSQWDDILLEYTDDVFDTAVRDNVNGIGKHKYNNMTGRNDFKRMKVTYDNENIYFYAETKDSITPYANDMWMNLYISIDTSLPNWEGYNYILNRTGVTPEYTTLERSVGGWSWETVNKRIKYTVLGSKMVIAVPLSDVGLNAAEKFKIDFKWHDNMQVQGDIFEFYLNGDAAPNFRFNYRFEID